jgi:hypothetical protein
MLVIAAVYDCPLHCLLDRDIVHLLFDSPIELLRGYEGMLPTIKNHLRILHAQAQLFPIKRGINPWCRSLVVKPIVALDLSTVGGVRDAEIACRRIDAGDPG